MKGLDSECVGAWKGEEHGYYGSQSVVTSTMSIAFRPEEIGYFDLHLDEAYGKGDIVQMGKDVYY